MNDSQPDWTAFTKRILIDASVQDAYDAWALPSRLTTWFLERADYTDTSGSPRGNDEHIQSGDKHTWKWHNWDLIEEGKVLEANGSDRISFTFGSGGEVHITINRRGEGCEVILRQVRIPEDDQSRMNIYVGCSTGWTFWLTNLKAWLEHGITLHATGLSQDETDNLVNS